MGEVQPAEPAGTAGQPLRALGAFEQAFYLYMQRNPVNFTLTGHLDGAPTEQQLSAALGDLQRVHPQLAATVTDRDAAAGQTAVFTSVPAPVPLTTHPAGTTWQHVAAGEQARRFDAARGPPWRAALVPPHPPQSPDGAPGTTVVLTFDHRIADGAAAVRVLGDLVATLNGHHLPAQPVPAAQDDLLEDLAGVLPTGAGGGGAAATDDDPRLDVMGALRPLDGTAPEVTSWAMDARSTADLVTAARAHGTTVHGALCAAATQVLRRSGRDFVRIVTPKDLRRTPGLEDGVANRILNSRTGFAASAARGFWGLARATTEALAPTAHRRRWWPSRRRCSRSSPSTRTAVRRCCSPPPARTCC